MVKQLTPYTVTFKKFEQTKKHEIDNTSGTLYFKNKRVLHFYSYKNSSGQQKLRVTTIYDAKVLNEMIAYQEENEKEDYLKTIESFVLKAAIIHILKKEASKMIRDFVKLNEIWSRLSVGVHVFINNYDDYHINILNYDYPELFSEDIEELKEAVQFEGLYDSYKEIYFMKYNTKSTFTVEKLK